MSDQENHPYEDPFFYCAKAARSERPRINIPLPSPEYLRYLEEQEEQEEKESNRGVTILQM